MRGAVEGLDRRARACRAERGVTAGEDPAAGIERIVAQHDVLAGDVLLIGAVAIVAADDAAVGRRALRPVDKPALEGELLARMVAGLDDQQRRRRPRQWQRRQST